MKIISMKITFKQQAQGMDTSNFSSLILEWQIVKLHNTNFNVIDREFQQGFLSRIRKVFRVVTKAVSGWIFQCVWCVCVSWFFFSV